VRLFSVTSVLFLRELCVFKPRKGVCLSHKEPNLAHSAIRSRIKGKIEAWA
jgi:hypothetical protein